MPQFRRGAAEIEKSTQRNSGGSLGKFAPSIYWGDDKEVKYLYFLNDIESIPRLDMINFIPVKNNDGELMYYASTIARSDACFGDDAVNPDPLVEKWDAPIKDSNLFVAVELEPVMEEKRGRQKPVGFKIKLNTFERRIRDDKGDLTDDTEEVTAPAYGFIQESASNFGAVLGSHDATEFPIEEWPIKIQRIGKKTDTKYTVTGYEDMAVDFTPFVENLDGITYLSDQMDELTAAVEGLDPLEAARAVGSVLLEARLNELADEERYEKLASGVTETLDRFGNKKKKAQTKSKGTQRRSSGPAPDQEEAAPAEEAEAKPKRGQGSTEALSALQELQANAKSRAKTTA
jgi:hypothetical protein